MDIRHLIAGMACAISAVAVVPAHATAGLDFVISGDTYLKPWSITNTSTAGEKISAFGITLNTPYGFDTAAGGYGIDYSAAFQPLKGSAATTGYTGPASVLEGTNSLAFTFDDFDPSEVFTWRIDVDKPGTAPVFGNQLAGSSAYVQFDNGAYAEGVLEKFGDLGSRFVVTNVTPAVPEPASWAMMIGGLGLVGAQMRRRRNQGLRVARA